MEGDSPGTELESYLFGFATILDRSPVRSERRDLRKFGTLAIMGTTERRI